MKNDIREDFIIFTALVGTIASAIRALFTLIFYLLDITQETSFFIFAKILFRTKNIPIDFNHFGYLALGLFAFLVFGATLTIGLGFIYLKFGTRFYLLKAVFYGILIWLTVRNILIYLIMPEKSLSLWTPLIALFSHVLYGLVSGYLIVRYGKFIPTSKSN